MSNKPRKINNHSHSNNYVHQHSRKKQKTKEILKWAAIILAILIMFWLYIAEDARA